LIQRRKIEKANKATAGRKIKLALRTIKKMCPVNPTDEQLIETFKGFTFSRKIGKYLKNEG